MKNILKISLKMIDKGMKKSFNQDELNTVQRSRSKKWCIRTEDFGNIMRDKILMFVSYGVIFITFWLLLIEPLVHHFNPNLHYSLETNEALLESLTQELRKSRSSCAQASGGSDAGL